MWHYKDKFNEVSPLEGIYHDVNFTSPVLFQNPYSPGTLVANYWVKFLDMN